MIVRFGLDLDNRSPDPAETRIGFAVAGPNLFLAILETQLGILSASVSEGKRIVQYRACLRGVDHPRRFFHRSLAADELGVARTLLHWRDTWYMAGWDGTISGTAGERLQDMADVEALAKENAAPGFGQRLAVVFHALKTHRTQIENVELIDAPTDYPVLWQRVLSYFRTSPLDVDTREPCGKAGSDLNLLQHALLSSRDAVPSRIELSGDGSVVVLTACSRAVSARLIAEYLKSDTERQVAVLTGSHGYELDEAFESIDVPKCGFQPLSTWRPPLQILPLALGLLWKPLDPVILSQFLNLPMAPLPGRVRAKLANVIVQHPGIGGPVWQETVSHLLTDEKSANETTGHRGDALAKAIDYWLAPERCDPETGAATATVAERCKQVADYLAIHVGTAKNDSIKALFASAHRQAADLAEAVDDLRDQGTTHIPRNQLERLLSFIAGGGSPLAGRIPEVRHAPATETPAAFITPRDELVWWDLSMPGLPVPHPWTRAEIDTLKNHGVNLTEIDRELQRLAKTWLRPVRNTRRRLVIVLHRGDDNHHPMWDHISTVCRGWVENDIDSLVRGGRENPELEVNISPLPTRQLPSLQRWWQLPNGRMLAGRSKESYTSLEDFVKSPYKWVLKHKAKLYPGGLESPASGNLLKGNLVHRLIECFFKDHPDWQKLREKQITSWLNHTLPRLLETEGATLLTPGKSVEKEQFRETALRALLSLSEHLKTAGISKVRVEHRETARFFGGELDGFIDMLLTDDHSRESVVDVKWGGYRYREEDLRQNRCLQLAVYAFMRKKSAALSYWPPVANFIIDRAHMLTLDGRAFPAAVVVRSESGEDVPHLWQRFEATWRWRRDQLDRGLVEVTVAGTEPTADSSPPESGMALETENDRFNDYAVLTGWGADR